MFLQVLAVPSFFILSCVLYATYLSIHHDGNMCLLQVLVVVTKATIKIYVQVFVWTNIFTSLGHMPTWGIAGSEGEYIFNFIKTSSF